MKKNDSKLGREQIKSIVTNGGTLTEDMIITLDEERIKEMISDIIPKSIIEQATKMNVDLKQHFLTLILTTKDTMAIREKLISTVAGIVGTVWANKYFERNGYKIENEVPVLDSKGKEITASDIVTTSQGGKRTFIELKTIKAIITNENEYPKTEVETEKDSDFLRTGSTVSRENFVDLKKSTLPEIAVKTGTKVVEQLKKTRDYIDRESKSNNTGVKLCVYRGTKISPEILEQIEQYGEIFELPLDVNKIFEYSTSLVGVIMHRGRNALFPVKGENTSKIPKGTEWQDGLKVEDIR